MHLKKLAISGGILVAALASSAQAQVTIDASKITCDQYVHSKIATPNYIAAWLSGYYHGTRRDMVVDLNALIADAGKVEDYCFTKPEVPLVQAIKTVLGISLGP